MSEQPPVSPKKRLDDDADEGEPPSAEITRCEELWFDDGNIVLQAETTQFRVHRSYISMHSPSFKDMFLIPQPEGEARVEGCPVIHVYDRAKDWENLLMAMYNNFKTNPMAKDYPIDRVMSLLRLGHKYQFHHFRAVASGYLKEAFPITLAEWDSSKAHIADMRDRDQEDAKRCFMSGYEIELVNIAMEVGLRSILPALFFVCIRDCTLEEIFHGYTKEDGTVWKLAPHVQETLLSARHRIAHRATLGTVIEPLTTIRKLREFTGEIDCKSPIACGQRSEAADERILLFQLEPGAALQQPEDLCSCEPCNEFLRRWLQGARKSIWRSLPGYFGLPEWEDATDLEGW